MLSVEKAYDFWSRNVPSYRELEYGLLGGMIMFVVASDDAVSWTAVL